MESPSLPGFDTAPNYTGEGKGGPDPYEEVVVFQTTLPLYTYIPKTHPHHNLSPRGYTYNTYFNYMTTPHLIKQIKSYWYYIFWSIATIAVVSGQIYVGLGYRDLVNALKLTLT